MYQNQQHPQYSQPVQQTQVQQSYTIQHDFDGSASVTATLTHAISDVSGIDVTEVERALADYVDPRALDRLFSPVSDGSPRLNGQLTFDMQGYQVRIEANGRVTIIPPRDFQATPHR